MKNGVKMSWKCKNCGGCLFSQPTKGNLNLTKIDKQGTVIECEETTLYYGYITCDKCKKRGIKIQNIAEWEKE
ncbi:hypothetical protein EII29_07745 [Leptotrichia sp. OH3620_COT-345]|uniref:hypothetical protein n=1 Tax=Leptotrichia sp. OH3620_COT-345 TaxID=2491048 RepID=UPI000F64FE0A|nr:hypothetical protein [Leptotrichia sp. OH3620_COT-345]RRD39291.1 hypothetical protein EII29_07745 [Leptotrichia sp. OH3620_COT-345]